MYIKIESNSLTQNFVMYTIIHAERVRKSLSKETIEKVIKKGRNRWKKNQKMLKIGLRDLHDI